MSLRRRLALLSALAVAFAVLLASALVYTLVRDRLRGDIDNDLRHQADVVTQRAQQLAPPVAGSAQGPVTIGTGRGAVSKAGKPPPLPGASRRPGRAGSRGRRRPRPAIGSSCSERCRSLARAGLPPWRS